MKKTILVLAALACSFSAMADQSVQQYCASRQPNQIKQLALYPFMRMGFQNEGGLINGGVCWWHARFQRNALYVTAYSPAKRMPTLEEARAIISAIREAKTIVEIPGFANFFDFSSHFRAEIQRELEKWQKGDGFIRMAWIKGLAGKVEVAPEKLKNAMDELFQEVEVKGNISYQKLQIQGVKAHAWLVTKMERLPDGYRLVVIDSNFPDENQVYDYRFGQTSLYSNYYGNFTPYLENKGEVDKLKQVIAKVCR